MNNTILDFRSRRITVQSMEKPVFTAESFNANRTKSTVKMVVNLAAPVATFGILLLFWEILPRMLSVPAYILPVPSAFFAKLWQEHAQIFGHSLITLQEVLYGFIAGVVVSVPMALVIVSNRFVERIVYPLVLFFQLVPKIAVAPLFVVWFGFGIFPKVFFTFILCFFPVLVSSMTGFRALDPRILQITRSMGASRWQTFRFVRLPTALPNIFSGMKVSVVLATTGAIVAEFVGANSGLGYLLLQATTFLDMPLIFAVLVALCALGLLFSYAVGALEKAVMPWTRRNV